jgi:hypothetical protein
MDGGWATVDSASPVGGFDSSCATKAGLSGVSAGAVGYQETLLGTFGVGSTSDASTGGAHDGMGVYSPFGSLESTYTSDAGSHFDGGAHLEGAFDRSVGVTSARGLGDLDVNQNVVPGVPGNVGDLAKSLADPTAAASAIAGAVPAMPALPGMPGLPGMSGLPGLPSMPELPAAGGLPALPALPGVSTDEVNHAMDPGQVVGDHALDGAQAGQLPHTLGHLPGGLTTLPQLPQLPVELPHLPMQLPVETPNLPMGADASGHGQADASGHGQVGGVMDHTGLGSAINSNPVTDVVHDVAPDLHLGL